jgi:DHA2 family multidrug resistance protein
MSGLHTEVTPPPLCGIKRFGSLLGLSLATFLIVLDYTIANVSIPYISGDLSVSTNEGTYVITSFAVGNAIILPITGYLTKRLGSIRLLIASILLFVLFSWICGSASNFRVLLIGRFLQGFVAGPLVPLSQSLIVSTNPPEKKNAVLAFWSMVVVAAPVIGPLLGGWISFDYSWPWIFYINIPFGILSALLVWFTLKEFETKPSFAPIDYIGFLLLGIGVTCLQILLDRGEQYDWLRSRYITTLAIISFVSFCYLLIWEYTHKTPMINLKLFAIRSYAVSVFLMGVTYAIYFGSVVLIPLWLQTNMGYNSIWAGVAVCPIGIAPLFFSLFMSKLVNRYGCLRLLTICFILLSISCFYTAYFTTAVDIQKVGISRLLLGCGLVFFITPLFSMSVQNIKTELLPQSTGIFHFIRAMSGGIGTAIFTTLWIRRTAYHHERIGSTLTPFSEETNNLFSSIHEIGLTKEKILELTNQLVDNQAAMLALNDCFYLMGWIFLAVILLLPIARQKQKQEEGATPPPATQE